MKSRNKNQLRGDCNRYYIVRHYWLRDDARRLLPRYSKLPDSHPQCSRRDGKSDETRWTEILIVISTITYSLRVALLPTDFTSLYGCNHDTKACPDRDPLHLGDWRAVCSTQETSRIDYRSVGGVFKKSHWIRTTSSGYSLLIRYSYCT